MSLSMSQSKLTAALLIVSDTAFKDPSSDRANELLRTTFDVEGKGQWDVTQSRIVQDEVVQIQRAITEWSDGPNAVNLVITTGGTGFAIRDTTPEAVAPLIHRHAPGLV